MKVFVVRPLLRLMLLRKGRVTPGGMLFHVSNRGVGRHRLFDKDGDYAAFETILAETLDNKPAAHPRLWFDSESLALRVMIHTDDHDPPDAHCYGE